MRQPISLYHGNSVLRMRSCGRWYGRLSNVTVDGSYSNIDCELSRC